jgi:hypothetical protein
MATATLATVIVAIRPESFAYFCIIVDVPARWDSLVSDI